MLMILFTDVCMRDYNYNESYVSTRMDGKQNSSCSYIRDQII